MGQVSDKRFDLFLNRTSVSHIVGQTALQVEKYANTVKQPLIFVVVFSLVVMFVFVLIQVIRDWGLGRDCKLDEGAVAVGSGSSRRRRWLRVKRVVKPKKQRAPQ